MQLAQLPDRAVKKIGVVDHQRDAVAFGQRHQIFALCHAGAHGFFDEHMLAVEERPARQGKMGGRGRGDRHRLDLGVIEHLCPVRIQPDRRARSPNPLPRAFPDVGHGHDVEPRIARKAPQQILAPIAMTTEPDFNDAHGACLGCHSDLPHGSVSPL